jgi:protein-tyrosine phosphatase
VADDAWWIDLDGAPNARDVGGLPVKAGGVVTPHRLLRSDHLQDLTPRDVRTLVDDYELRAVLDVRTAAEVKASGPTRLAAEASVAYLNASLFLEEDTAGVEVLDTDAGPTVLPWHNRAPGERGSAADIYLAYLTDRPESVIAALRLIANTEGAAIVHCAAGKDRTGVIVALALDAVGVPRTAIVDEYARTADRLTEMLLHLASSPLYADGTDINDPDRHAPQPATLREFLRRLDDDFGGSAAWLTSHGWTDADQAALVAHLTGA